MIRPVVFILTVIFSCSVQAGELCDVSNSKIAEDMRIPEKEFTSKAFEESLERLAQLGREPATELSWLIIGNSFQFIKGWLLKKAALDALETSSEFDDARKIEEFCYFLINHAHYYD